MLIGSRMEHVVGLVSLEERIHTRLSADTRHNGQRLHVGELLRHHQTHVVHRSLSLVDKDHMGGLIGSHLSHDLRTDTAGSTGDKDGGACQHLTE